MTDQQQAKLLCDSESNTLSPIREDVRTIVARGLLRLKAYSDKYKKT